VSWLDGAAADGDRYLPDTVRLLWPEPAYLFATRRDVDRSGQVRSYVVVPSARRPKVLIPATPRAAAAAIRGFKSTQDRREAWILAALAAAFRCGAGAALPHKLYVSVPPGRGLDDLESHLAAVFQRPVHVSLHVSAPRAVRKPVLQLIDDVGHTFAFVKVGANPLTDRLVRAESATVQRLSGIPWRVLRVPRVLHAGRWREHAVLVQQALPRSSATRDARAVAVAMDELARVDGTDVVTLCGSRYFTGLLERSQRLPASTVRDVIMGSLRELTHNHHAAPVELGAGHGDWTPWNMNVCGGRVQVWDWEKFEVGVPIGFDAAHCFVQGAVVWDARQPAEVFADLIDTAEPVHAAHGSNRAAARLVCWLYALNLAITYLEDGETGIAGSPLTRLETWLPHTVRLAAARTATAGARS
jgi:hypothetical protein